MMHELSVCSALLDQVARLAARHGASGVSMVSLRLGPLSGIEPALLRAAYREARRGTPAQDAELAIVEVPLRIACLRCGAAGDAALDRLSCAICGSGLTRLLSGDEMLLDSVDLVFPGQST
ncbi:hydrogenase maturation nickel metallochaperone HypA [Massilia sp. DD77]